MDPTISSAPPEDEFEVFADLYAKPGRGDDLECALRRVIRRVESEPGTLIYAIARDGENPNRFRVFERYTGREAFEKHFMSPEVKALIDADAMEDPGSPKFFKVLKGL
ncbi:hypothetical protein PV08_05153 [Exophiala spinifera]|uniref:ABM domain-containing protein n=1 Tax=Exophiala spinifera TaxID=91928 RepID=A0A0D2BG58_9EURO|nr:uncharacterized protein PV08_05153 [Exophiala spinifera]KIW17958.1 hypothetical protein PV08_05153 [Exophiala spinifera]